MRFGPFYEHQSNVAVRGRRRLQVGTTLAGRLGSAGRRLVRRVPVPLAVALTLNPIGAFVIRRLMARSIDPSRTKDRPITVSFELRSQRRCIAWSVQLPADTREGTPGARGTRGLDDDADVTISLDFGDILRVVNGRADALDLLHGERVKVVGDSAALVSFLGTFTVGPQLY